MLIPKWEKLPIKMQIEEIKPYYLLLRKKNFSLFLKRVFDIFLAFFLLILLSPVFFILSIAIKIDSKGPVFFRQERITQYAKHYRIFKFRTMVNNADKLGFQVTVKNDSRITRVGKLIRKCRLDEIPQLLNILAGSMTFVGERDIIVTTKKNIVFSRVVAANCRSQNRTLRSVNTMNKNLLIVGAGAYGIVASEIAREMGCFDKVDFVDDELQSTPTNVNIVGTVKDIDELNEQYSYIIVALDDSEKRIMLLNKIEEETSYRIATLISPKAHIAASAQIMNGCIIEPMAMVHSLSVISAGCIISAGAVVSYASMCCDGVLVGCNATVTNSTLVPAGTKIKCGEVYDRNAVDPMDLFFDSEKWAKRLNDMKAKTLSHTPTPMNGNTYNFDDVM